MKQKQAVLSLGTLRSAILLTVFATVTSANASPHGESGLPTRVKYDQSEEMPDAIAMSILAKYVASQQSKNPERLMRAAKQGAIADEATAERIVAALSAFSSNVESGIRAEVQSTLCADDAYVLDETRAQQGLNLIDDIRVLTYEKEYKKAKASLSEADFTALDRWVQDTKLGSTYVQFDHEKMSDGRAAAGIASYCVQH